MIRAPCTILSCRLVTLSRCATECAMVCAQNYSRRTASSVARPPDAQQSTIWSDEDTNVLQIRILVYGENWKEVASGFARHTPEECKAQWEDLHRSQSLHSAKQPSSYYTQFKWSEEDESQLDKVVFELSKTKDTGSRGFWSAVAEALARGRGAPSCRAKYTRMSKKRLNKTGKWAIQEILLLRQLLVQYGYDIPKVVTEFPTRSPADIVAKAKTMSETHRHAPLSVEETIAKLKELFVEDYWRDDRGCIRWSAIAADAFVGQNVTAETLRLRWRDFLSAVDENKHTGSWDQEEIRRFHEAISAIDESDAFKWKKISDVVKTRTPKQCACFHSGRYLRNLSNTAEQKTDWTYTETEELIESARKFQCQWTQIKRTGAFPSRSQFSLSRKFWQLRNATDVGSTLGGLAREIWLESDGSRRARTPHKARETPRSSAVSTEY